jgi:hypothetical protein
MTLDPKITWALIIALFLESAAAFIWAGRLSARLEAVEARLVLAEPTAARLAALETRMSDLQLSIDRVERRLEARR